MKQNIKQRNRCTHILTPDTWQIAQQVGLFKKLGKFSIYKRKTEIRPLLHNTHKDNKNQFHEKAFRQTQIDGYSTKYMINIPQNCQGH